MTFSQKGDNASGNNPDPVAGLDGSDVFQTEIGMEAKPTTNIEKEKVQKMKVAPLCPSTAGGAIGFVTIAKASMTVPKTWIRSNPGDLEAWRCPKDQNLQPAAAHGSGHRPSIRSPSMEPAPPMDRDG